jgi:hypothetical protein
VSPVSAGYYVLRCRSLENCCVVTSSQIRCVIRNSHSSSISLRFPFGPLFSALPASLVASFQSRATVPSKYSKLPAIIKVDRVPSSPLLGLARTVHRPGHLCLMCQPLPSSGWRASPCGNYSPCLWRSAPKRLQLIVKPKTVIAWRRKSFRLFCGRRGATVAQCMVRIVNLLPRRDERSCVPGQSPPELDAAGKFHLVASQAVCGAKVMKAEHRVWARACFKNQASTRTRFNAAVIAQCCKLVFASPT